MFEGTNAPDASALESSADKFGASEENFKTVAQSIKDDLMKASEIISNAASKNEEKTESDNQETKTETETETENQETQKEEVPAAEEEPKKTNLPALMLGIACAIELIIIVLLLIF